MRKILCALVSILLLAVLFAPLASGEPVASGFGTGAGWTVEVGGVAQATLVPEATAQVPTNCPAAGPCENHDSEQLANLTVGTTTARANLLRAEADAYRDETIVPTLVDEIDAATAVDLPAEWNTRGYNRVEGFSALNGAILVDTIQAEAVSGTRTSGANILEASASGARLDNIRLAGILAGQTLAPIDPTKVNQVLLDVDILGYGRVTITYWETNWDPTTLSTPGDQPVWVNALHITAPGGIDIVVSQARAASTYVPPPNRPPVAVDDTATTTEAAPVAIDVVQNDSDPDGNLVNSSVRVTQQPANGSVTCNNAGTCTYTPRAGFTGEDSFKYQVCDSDSACDTATVTITVGPAVGGGGGGVVNQSPDAVDKTKTTPQNTAISFNITDGDSDPEGRLDNTSVRIVTQPSSGTIRCEDNLCSYTPATDFIGQVTFEYQVCDLDGACDTATVTINVTEPAAGDPPPTNLAPNARDDNAQTNAGSPVRIDVVANDDDGDPDDGTDDLDRSSVEIVTYPTNGSVICNNSGVCTYTPDGGSDEDDTFTYIVCDTDDACDTATVTVVVNPAATGNSGNLPPIAVDDSGSTTVGNSITLPVIGNDDDRGENDLNPTSIAVSQHPANGAVVCSNGSCTYTPAPGFVGEDFFDYRICDTSNACDTGRVVITVTMPLPAPPPPNAPPAARDDSASTDAGQPVTIPVATNDSDPENRLDEGSVSVVSPPANGAVTCAAGACTYTPEPGFAGNDSFDYQICDALGQCDVATVVVVVLPPVVETAPPVAADDAASTRAKTPVVITVTQNDSDPDGDLDTSSVRVVRQPTNGTVTCVANVCTYTPDDGFTGDDGFIYEVCDSEGTCDTAVVTITVTAPTNNTDGGGAGGNGPGGNNGPDGNNGGPDRPVDLDSDPSMPGGDNPPLAAPIPIPSVGSPGSFLPLTGGTPGGYVTLALYAMAVGMLVLWRSRTTPEVASVKPMRFWDAPPPHRETPSLVDVARAGTELTGGMTAIEASPATEANDPVTELTPPTVDEAPAQAEATPAASAKAAPVKQAKKTTAKKTTAKKTTATKATATKATATKATAKKATAKKATAKKATAKKTTAKKTTAKKTTAKKTTAKKTTAKKTTATKATAKKSTTAKAAPKNTTAKKTTAKATTAKKSTIAKSSTGTGTKASTAKKRTVQKSSDAEAVNAATPRRAKSTKKSTVKKRTSRSAAA